MKPLLAAQRAAAVALLVTLLAGCAGAARADVPPTATATDVPQPPTATATGAPQPQPPTATATSAPQAPTATAAPQGPPAGEWQAGPWGDLNADGISDQISYRPAQIQLPPIGFSDPSIVALMIAEELVVLQEASPRGRELLTLGPAALSAEGLELARFDGEIAPAGFIVVAYSGDPQLLRVTPLRGDGELFGGQAYEVVWDRAAGGYRLR